MLSFLCCCLFAFTAAFFYPNSSQRSSPRMLTSSGCAPRLEKKMQRVKTIRSGALGRRQGKKKKPQYTGRLAQKVEL
ncbi:hypothetical protein F5H01DRAFT_348189 [Linnemannia elongata]|nr:hypothetical protein F5H01DRAFT_348189 [Linnemannia elongata]